MSDRLGAISRLAELLGMPGPAGDRDRLPLVAFAGGTGSGKSSLVDALAGRPVSAVGELRPTTSEAVAVFPAGAGTDAAALDRLGVLRRHVGLHTGPVLLDLPDLDSVVTGHRSLVEAVLGVVDGIVWVVDPEKYADAAVHEALAGFPDIPSVVALNHVDRLAGHERLVVLDDLRSLAAGRPVLATAVPPDGEASGIGALAEWLAGVEAPELDRPTRVLAGKLLGMAGPPHEPPAEVAWSAAEATVGGFVDRCVERADARLRATGPRTALLGMRRAPDTPAAVPAVPPSPTGWPPVGAISPVVAGWGRASSALTDAADAVALLSASSVVRPRSSWPWLRVISVLGLIGGVAGAALLEPWWAGSAVAVAGLAVGMALALGGRSAGRDAAGRTRAEAAAVWAAALGSEAVATLRDRCRRADEVAAAAASVGMVDIPELGPGPEA